MSATSTAKVVDPPFYDPVLTDGATHSQAWTEFNQAVADQINNIVATDGVGVTDGSDAAAGKVGEYMTASAGGVGLTNNVASNIVSLDLTAGDWDVSGNCQFSASGSAVTFEAGIDGLDTRINATFPGGGSTQGISTAVQRKNGTATVTVWLVALASFSSTVTASGTIRARRMR